MTIHLNSMHVRLFVILMLAAPAVFSQSNFYKFGVGANAGVNRAFTDVSEATYALSYQANALYYATPYIAAGLEGQWGKIKGGNIVTDPRNREFINSYAQYTFNVRMYAGQFLAEREGPFLTLLKPLYVSAGMGVLLNKMDFIVRTQPVTNYVFEGKDKSSNLTTPFNIGYDLNLSGKETISKLTLNINLQHNITYGEGLDGYNDSMLKFNNKHPDMFTVLSLGMRYHFGGMGLFYKPGGAR